MSEVYLSLGSNIGDSVEILKTAIKQIDDVKSTYVTKISKLYITEPIGYVEQNDFYNCCIKIETSLLPIELLNEIQAIELKAGRERIIRFGPRTLDIDILLFDRLTINTERLIIPHERMFERTFTLVPIFDILNENNCYYNKVVERIEVLGDSQKIKVDECHSWEEK